MARFKKEMALKLPWPHSSYLIIMIRKKKCLKPFKFFFCNSLYESFVVQIALAFSTDVICLMHKTRDQIQYGIKPLLSQISRQIDSICCYT